MSSWLRNILLIYLPKMLFMKRPDIPLRYVYIKEKSNSTYQWKDERRRQIVKITSDHIAFITEQIENAKNEKQVLWIFFLNFINFFLFRSSKNGVLLL
jgi:hypothetical protein